MPLELEWKHNLLKEDPAARPLLREKNSNASQTLIQVVLLAPVYDDRREQANWYIIIAWIAQN